MDLGQESFVVLDTTQSSWSRAPEIRLSRLERHLRVEKFRQPPIEESGIHLRMQRFPSWLFCPSCRRMWRWGRKEELDGDKDLPKCRNAGCNDVILVPMRYVAVCRNGHITDVDWFKWAHSDPDTRSVGACDAHHQQLKFTTLSDIGSSLESLRIECTRCNSYRSLQDLSHSDALKRAGQNCWGRQPWQGRDEEVGCDAPLKALLRSQTAVHFSDLRSALDVTINPAHEDNIFQEEFLRLVSDMQTYNGFSEPEQYEPNITRLAQLIGRRIGREVTAGELRNALVTHYSRSQRKDDEVEPTNTEPEDRLLRDEWPALTTPTPNRSPSAQLIVTRSDWPGNGPRTEHLTRLIKNIYLIERLREVRAMRGFRRLEPDAELVPPNLNRGGSPAWLPAIEVFGEGLFIEFDCEAVNQWEHLQRDALDRHLSNLIERISESQGLASRFQPMLRILARFILAHTFSHVLMRQLCYESGYGGASLRERLYVFEDRVGLLIYTADGDSEGSLGGLVRQGHADRLGPVVLSMLERASWCSNDPICAEMPQQGLDGLNRAACHACTLSPETSCDYLNSLLDRMLLIGDGETTSQGVNSPRGYFRDLLEGSDSAATQ